MHDIHRQMSTRIASKNTPIVSYMLIQISNFFSSISSVEMQIPMWNLQVVYSQSAKSNIACKLEYHLQHWNHVSEFSNQNSPPFILRQFYLSTHSMYIQSLKTLTTNEWVLNIVVFSGFRYYFSAPGAAWNTSKMQRTIFRASWESSNGKFNLWGNIEVQK